jgi:hypothetical protein
MLAARTTLPFLRFVGDELAEISRRACNRDAAEPYEAGLHRSISKAGIDFLVQLFDDFGGRVLGCAHAVPGTRLEAGQKFGHGWHVRQRFRTCRGGYRQRAQPDRFIQQFWAKVSCWTLGLLGLHARRRR